MTSSLGRGVIWLAQPRSQWSPRRRLLTLIWCVASLIVLTGLWVLAMASGHLLTASLITLLLAISQHPLSSVSSKSSVFRTTGDSTGPRGLLARARRWYHRRSGHIVVRTVGRHRSLVRLRSGQQQTYFARVFWCAHCKKEWRC